MNDLILVIDMQNAYREGMPWACHAFGDTISNIKKLLDSGRDAAFTLFIPPAKPFGAWNEYMRVNKSINENEWAGKLIDELVPYTEHYPVFEKSTYSSLSNPVFRELAHKYERLVVTGVVAECCVLSTVLSAIHEGLPFVYLKDAVSGLSPVTESESEAIVSYMTPVHGTIMTVDEYLES